jgi:uncharacterized membrane protein
MFSDGVIAIIITIMVLELAQPAGPTWKDLLHERRHFAIYALSFIGLGIYWNSHHQMFHIVDRINARVLWTNLHLLFWLSLVPYVTAWVGNQGVTTATAAAYVVVHLMSGVSFLVMTIALIQEHGSDSRLVATVGRDIKGKLSLGLYLLGLGLAFVWPPLSLVACTVVALIWIVPDWRMRGAGS